MIHPFCRPSRIWRPAAARAACADRLRQLGLAAHNYDTVHSRFPAGKSPFGPSFPPDALPASAWTAHLLPHLEQSPLWDAMLASYRFTPDVTAATHTGRAVAVAAFACPSDGRLATAQLARGERVQVGLTSYLGVAGTASWRKDGVLFSGRGVRLGEVTDGTSNTLFAGERPPDEWFDLGWWYAGRGIDGAGTFDMLMGVAENDPSPLTATACGLPVVPFGPATGVGDRCGPFHF